MILLDFSQVMMANMHVQINNGVFGEKEFRSLVFQSIRKYNRTYRDEFGELVICCDSSRNWRKTVYPLYKASRSSDRSKGDIDWDEAFRIFNLTINDVYEQLPYRVVSVELAEADDIIGTLALKKMTENGVIERRDEPVLIISGDKDFKFLQAHPHIKQWSPSTKDFLVEENPKEFFIDLVLRGDKSDGVPNVLSDDDTFITEGKVQNKLTKKKKAEILEKIKNGKIDELPENIQKNLERNRKMIDLSESPRELRLEILKRSLYPPKGDMRKTFNFLINSGISTLLNDIEGFKPGV